MTPTPDTTARTETAETVTVPYDDFHAAYRHVPRSRMFPDDCLKTRLRALLHAEDIAHADEAETIALVSPQHPVGVREALNEDVARRLREVSRTLWSGAKAVALDYGNLARDIDAALATLSHPPVQDAPGAEAIAALARGYELMQRVIWNMAGTSGPDAAWYRQQAQAVTDRVDALWKVEAGSNPSRPGDCLTQADKFLATLSHPPAQDAPGTVKVKALEWKHLGGAFWRAKMPLFGTLRVENYGNGHLVTWSVPGFTSQFIDGRWDSADDAKAAAQADFDRRILAALDPSPPLPEADGEVVAWAYEIQQHDDSWRADLSYSKPVAPYGGAIRNVEPLVRQSALVAALRERDEAHKRENDLAADVASQAMDLALERAAREKAEQVAAGLRERVESTAALIERVGGLPAKTGYGSEYAIIAVSDPREFAAALRAATEEGKTATPSVKEEEAGRG